MIFGTHIGQAGIQGQKDPVGQRTSGPVSVQAPSALADACKALPIQ